MRFVTSLLATALIAGAAPLMSVATASAAPVHDPMHLRNAVPSMTETVQYRRGHRRGGWNRHGGWNRYGRWDNRRHYRSGWGWGAPAAGLAAGAIIGGAIASQSAARADSVEYCMQRYRSYDPGSGTYLGYDGIRHPCP
jgi:hypothetical protein